MLFLQYQQKSLSLTKHRVFFFFIFLVIKWMSDAAELCMFQEMMSIGYMKWTSTKAIAPMSCEPFWSEPSLVASYFQLFLEVVLSDKKTTYNDWLDLLPIDFCCEFTLMPSKTYLQQSFWWCQAQHVHGGFHTSSLARSATVKAWIPKIDVLNLRLLACENTFWIVIIIQLFSHNERKTSSNCLTEMFWIPKGRWWSGCLHKKV